MAAAAGCHDWSSYQILARNCKLKKKYSIKIFYEKFALTKTFSGFNAFHQTVDK